MEPIEMLIILGVIVVLVMGGLTYLSNNYTLNGIKSKAVGMVNMVQPDLQQKRKLRKPIRR